MNTQKFAIISWQLANYICKQMVRLILQKKATLPTHTPMDSSVAFAK